MVFTDEGVELYTEDGALIGTVIFLADGDYRVVFPDGESERVALYGTRCRGQLLPRQPLVCGAALGQLAECGASFGLL